MSQEIVDAVRLLGREKGISEEKLMGALEDALLSAYKKQPGAARYARVRMDRDSGDFRVDELLLPPDLEEQLLDEAEEAATLEERRVDPETGEVIIPEAPDIDPARLAEFEDQIETRDVTPHDFGRIAAQTAKQVILQRIREAERDMMFEEYRDRVGELITGIVQQSDSRYTLVQLRERVEALLPKSEQADGVDPVGACVGPRGSRVRMVVSELRGEKIDIIPYNDEPARFVAKALSPARVREVLVDDSNKQATVIVPDDQLSLAIGREGQNARLAARLTGWRVDIRSETEFSREEQETGYEEEELGGRCAAILANGRRCPNAALPGSRYCGLEAHQALEGKDTDVVGSA